jgi:hypothetical protein
MQPTADVRTCSKPATRDDVVELLWMPRSTDFRSVAVWCPVVTKTHWVMRGYARPADRLCSLRHARGGSPTAIF